MMAVIESGTDMPERNEYWSSMPTIKAYALMAIISNFISRTNAQTDIRVFNSIDFFYCSAVFAFISILMYDCTIVNMMDADHCCQSYKRATQQAMTAALQPGSKKFLS